MAPFFPFDFGGVPGTTPTTEMPLIFIADGRAGLYRLPGARATIGSAASHCDLFRADCRPGYHRFHLGRLVQRSRSFMSLRAPPL